MFRRSISRDAASAGGLLLLVASLLFGLLGGTAFASSPPVNTAAPTISPNPPKVASVATATTGTWNSEAPAHWYGEGTQLKEGEKVGVTALGGPITMAAVVGGLSGSVTCETTVTGSSLENPSGGGAGTGNAELTYKNCKAEGPWTKCTVTPGSAASVKLELSSLEGKAKISILPVGSELGSFTFAGASCPAAVKGTKKLVGAIKGFYSNAASQIEFTPSSTSGALWFNIVNEGPSVSATGTIGLKTSKGGNVGADSLTYSYQWLRCGVPCVAIEGATGQTYTPVVADQGKSLKVEVTATDSFGSTTAVSTPSSLVIGSLSWYACGKWGEPGTYESATCTKTGASNPYSWLRPSTMPFTVGNTLESGEKQPTVIEWNNGANFRIECGGTSGEGTLTNGANQASIENYNLTLSECILYRGTCQLENSTLAFNTMKAQSPEASTSELKPELKFEPSSAAALVNFNIKNCGWAGSYKLIGTLPATMQSSGSFISSSGPDMLSSKTVRVNESSGPVVGIESATRILGEGSKSLKLDNAP